MCECGKPAFLFCEKCESNLCEGCHALPFQKRHATTAPRRTGGASAEAVCAKHKERLHFVCDVDGELLCLVCQHAPEHKVGSCWPAACIYLYVCACTSLSVTVCMCACARLCMCMRASVQGHAVTQLNDRVEQAHAELGTELDKLIAQIARQRDSLPAVLATRASVEQVAVRLPACPQTYECVRACVCEYLCACG